MKYSSTDRLEDFEFRDTAFTKSRLEGGTLTTEAREMNIRKKTPQNPSEYDLEIQSARIVFQGFCVHTFIKLDGKNAEERLEGAEAEQELRKHFKEGIRILSLGKEAGSRYSMEAKRPGTGFTVGFSFQSVSVEWDAYRRVAWYENSRSYTFDGTLDTPEGTQDATVRLSCHYEDERKKVITSASAYLDYGETMIFGEGQALSWQDALLNLQRKLPEGEKIRCCLTCTRGRMSPPTEFYCEKNKTRGYYSSLCGEYQP